VRVSEWPALVVFLAKGKAIVLALVLCKPSVLPSNQFVLSRNPSLTVVCRIVGRIGGPNSVIEIFAIWKLHGIHLPLLLL